QPKQTYRVRNPIETRAGYSLRNIRRNAMYLKATVFSAAILMAGCASVQAPSSAVNLPDKLKPSNESLALIVPPKGVRIYECRAQGGNYVWAFVAPEAELFDATGKRIGKHYAGPHWESPDGSRIVGSVRESAASPRFDSIPWVLLTAKSVGSQGSFS